MIWTHFSLSKSSKTFVFVESNFLLNVKDMLFLIYRHNFFFLAICVTRFCWKMWSEYLSMTYDEVMKFEWKVTWHFPGIFWVDPIRPGYQRPEFAKGTWNLEPPATHDRQRLSHIDYLASTAAIIRSILKNFASRFEKAWLHSKLSPSSRFSNIGQTRF